VVCDRIVVIEKRLNQLVIDGALEIPLAIAQVSVAHWSEDFLEDCCLVET
jgi:hypothetical protein